MVGPVQKSHRPTQETHAASQVEGRVPLAIAHERVGVGLQQVLDDLVLLSQHRQVQRRLEETQIKIDNKVTLHLHILFDYIHAPQFFVCSILVQPFTCLRLFRQSTTGVSVGGSCGNTSSSCSTTSWWLWMMARWRALFGTITVTISMKHTQYLLPSVVPYQC